MDRAVEQATGGGAPQPAESTADPWQRSTQWGWHDHQATGGGAPQPAESTANPGDKRALSTSDQTTSQSGLAPKESHWKDTADSPRPLRDPYAPRPAGSSLSGLYNDGMQPGDALSVGGASEISDDDKMKILDDLEGPIAK